MTVLSFDRPSIRSFLALVFLGGLAFGCGSSSGTRTEPEKEIPARDCHVDFDRKNYVLARVTATARFEHSARQIALARAGRRITRKITNYTSDFLQQNERRIRQREGGRDRSPATDSIASAFREVAAAKLGGLRVLNCDTYVEDGGELYRFYATVGMRKGELAEKWNRRVEANPILNASFADQELRELTKTWVQYIATREGAASGSESGSGVERPE